MVSKKKKNLIAYYRLFISLAYFKINLRSIKFAMKAENTEVSRKKRFLCVSSIFFFKFVSPEI